MLFRSLTNSYGQTYVIAQSVNFSNGLYPWRVGDTANTAATYGYNASSIPDGQYRIRICRAGTSDCDMSDSYFTISTSGGNTYPNPTGYGPTVTGVDAPTSLTTGQTGTWIVRATDPQNSYLSYAVTWGDEYGYAATQSSLSTQQFLQTASFSHVYSNPGKIGRAHV